MSSFTVQERNSRSDVVGLTERMKTSVLTFFRRVRNTGDI